MKNSKCATKEEEKQYLYELLGNKQLVTTLLYRGSDHGWLKKDYESRYDYEKSAIFLFKIKDGDCIGVYEMISLSPNGSKTYDEKLFNLSSFHNFPRKGKNFFYINDPNSTKFTGGIDELESCKEPFNGEGNFISCSNKTIYEIPLNEAGLNMLTNKKDGNFTISELEVWEVTNT